VPGRRVDFTAGAGGIAVDYGLRAIRDFDSRGFGTVDISLPKVLQARTSQGSVITFSMQKLDWQLRCCVRRRKRPLRGRPNRLPPLIYRAEQQSRHVD